jgi:hypothetical protein
VCPIGVRESPWSASFDDYFRARAAVSEVPTALAGAALRPVADGLYQVVDEIPAPIRRPFDRALGILLDNAVSLPANALTTRIPITTGPLPGAVDLGLPAYPQMQNSCGETMIATWLKAQGVPIALGEVDTQTPFFEGTNLLVDAELRNRGFSLISGPGTMEDLRTYLAHGYPVMVSVGWPNGGGHYAVVTGYDESTRMLTIDSYNADGKVAKVSYDEFAGDWGRHANLMTVAHPQRDAPTSTWRGWTGAVRLRRPRDPSWLHSNSPRPRGVDGRVRSGSAGRGTRPGSTRLATSTWRGWTGAVRLRRPRDPSWLHSTQATSTWRGWTGAVRLRRPRDPSWLPIRTYRCRSSTTRGAGWPR